MRHRFYFTKKKVIKEEKREQERVLHVIRKLQCSLSKRKIYFNFSRISYSKRSYACAVRKKSANYKIITTIQNIKKKLSVGVKKYYMKQNSACLKGLFFTFSIYKQWKSQLRRQRRMWKSILYDFSSHSFLIQNV